MAARIVPALLIGLLGLPASMGLPATAEAQDRAVGPARAAPSEGARRRHIRRAGPDALVHKPQPVVRAHWERLYRNGAAEHPSLGNRAAYADRVLRREIANALMHDLPRGPHARDIARALDALVQQETADLDRALSDLIDGQRGNKKQAFAAYVSRFQERWAQVHRAQSRRNRDTVVDRLAKLRLRRSLWRYDHAEPTLLPPLQETVDTPPAVKGSVQDRFTWAARQAEVLAGSGDPLERREASGLLSELRQVLPRDLSTWARSRLTSFADHQRENQRWFAEHTYIRHAPGATAERRLAIEETVNQAWAILSQAVHPDVLRALPEVQVRVAPGRASYRPGTPSGHLITIDPESKVKTVLHEFGHHLEFHTPSIKGMAMGQQMRRAYGYRPKRRGPEWPATEVVFPGAGRKDYRNRHYRDSSHTEITSMGVEKLLSKRTLAAALREEPYTTLQLLTAIQVPY